MVSTTLYFIIRNWSLITGRGLHVKFTPTKRGGGKSFSHAEGGGGTTFLGVVFTR